MRMHITHERLQHGIGQGGFHSAKIRVRPQDDRHHPAEYRYDYVYDCGAVSFGKKSLLKKSIESLDLKTRPDSADKKVLDALVLSHYDQDHIVGAKQLVSMYDVRRIYLPYLSPGELALVLASQAERWRPMQIRALHRLAVGGERLFGVNVTMVGPTSDDGDPDGQPPDRLFPQDGQSTVADEAGSGGGRSTQSMAAMPRAVGESIQAGDATTPPVNGEVILGVPGQAASEALWTLRFWNRGVQPALLVQLRKNLTKCGFPLGALVSLKGASQLVKWLGVTGNRDAAVAAYRAAINQTRPHGARAVSGSDISNFISLGLYSGPTQRPEWHYCGYRMRCWDDTGSGEGFWSQPGCAPCSAKGRCRSGWLGTGDAPLGDPAVWSDFENRYSQQLEEVQTVQVPHHGAAPKGGPAFFNPGLLPVPHLNAVVSVGIKNAYGHPEGSVTQAIQKAKGRLHLINERKHPGFEERVEYWLRR